MTERKDLFGRVLAGARLGRTARVAVRDSTGALTWDELLSGALGVAATLERAGVGPGDRVALWMEKTPRTVQALLGVLAAGAAYVPMDPKNPWRRCARILEGAKPSALVVDAQRAPHVHEVLSGRSECRLLLVDGGVNLATGDREALTLEQALSTPHRMLPAPEPAGLSYVLYTSGSTGLPKGVSHTHASGLAFVDWVLRTFSAGVDDVFSSHAPFHFDLSISDLFAALAAGATVRLFNTVEAMAAPWLARAVREEGITFWYSVPSALVMMMEQGDLAQAGWPRVHTVLFAGEVLPTPQLRRLRKALPHVDLCNLYGPTETNVCTWYRVPASMDDWPDDSPIPIGAVCDHLRGFVVDDAGREVARGEEGTLWIAGPNLMQGYYGDPARTCAVLTRHPAGGGEIAYCTGDRVRERADGGYDFIGRKDHQIKRRGYRIELGELEAVFAAHPGVVEAIAWALPDEGAGNRIYVTVVPGRGETLDVAALQAFCRERLPIYMVPDGVEVLGEVPRTSTGKADRGALVARWREEEGTR